MSYALRVKVTGGTPVIEEHSGELPDGDFYLAGHQDGALEELSVTRRDAHGQFAGSASHAHPVPAPAGKPNPHAAGHQPHHEGM